MSGWPNPVRCQYSSATGERVLVSDLEIISALEVKIVIEHVTSDLDQARTEQRQQERRPTERVHCLPGDDAPEYDGHEGRLQEWDPHRFEPQSNEGWLFGVDAWVG